MIFLLMIFNACVLSAQQCFTLSFFARKITPLQDYSYVTDITSNYFRIQLQTFQMESIACILLLLLFFFSSLKQNHQRYLYLCTNKTKCILSLPKDLVIQSEIKP